MTMGAASYDDAKDELSTGLLGPEIGFLWR